MVPKVKNNRIKSFQPNLLFINFPISSIVHDSNIKHLLFASLISVYPKTSFPSIFLSIYLLRLGAASIVHDGDRQRLWQTNGISNLNKHNFSKNTNV